MALYKNWCTGAKQKTKKKTFRAYTEKTGGRVKVLTQLGETVRAHCDQADRIADDVARLGYDAAAEILRALLPQSTRARSGDLGEILASQLVEEEVGFRVPVRRMRFKDGREVAMRGDDFIGVGYDKEDRLWLLKGESKSREALNITTIAEAREAFLDKARQDGVWGRLLDRGAAWSDFRRVVRFKSSAAGPRRGVFCARVTQGERSAQMERFGPGVVKWPP
jgi:hypothetical protein